MERLAGRTAVVTGAASGIGRALATRFAAEGMQVVLADVEEEPLREATAAIGDAAIGVTTDVSDAASVERLAARAAERFGAVHVLCNNAGVFLPSTGPLWETSPNEWQWVFGVNVHGIVNGIRAFVPGMLAHGEEGHVVNTASLAGLLGFGSGGAYGPSKHAAVGLSEQLALELEEASGGRIGVSVLCPAWVRTRIVEADRNRPAHLVEPGGPDPTALAKRAVLTEQMQAGATDPADIAGAVVDAIRSRRLFITPDPEWNAAVLERAERIVTGSPAVLPVPARA